MQFIVIYRQFVLRQELQDFGAIPIRKLKVKSILLIYALFVLLGKRRLEKELE
jgi:hypothetical protein